MVTAEVVERGDRVLVKAGLKSRNLKKIVFDNDRNGTVFRVRGDEAIVLVSGYRETPIYLLNDLKLLEKDYYQFQPQVGTLLFLTMLYGEPRD